MPLVFVNLLQTTGTKGGIEIYVQELYKEFSRLSTDLSFIGFASKEFFDHDHSWFPGELINSGISGENRFTWAAGELFKVSPEASKVKADLIHGPAMFGPISSPIPVVTSFHDVLYFSHPELMKSKFLTEPVKWMEKRAASISKRIITISNYSAKGIEQYLNVPKEKIDVIPLAGREIASTTPSAERKNNLFIAMGQRSPYKNFETIIQAWAQIPAETRPQLVITGSHEKDPLIPLVNELGLQDFVDLKSWISKDELQKLMQTATALIDSTLASGFSMPALEAMTIGLPVIMSDTDVFREVGADAALYFAPGNADSLVKKVVELSNSHQLRNNLTNKGLQRASEFSWSKVAEETEKCFQKALLPN
jgi:glycosyltransferase involved in cell wall biosynthesis